MKKLTLPADMEAGLVVAYSQGLVTPTVFRAYKLSPLGDTLYGMIHHLRAQGAETVSSEVIQRFGRDAGLNTAELADYLAAGKSGSVACPSAAKAWAKVETVHRIQQVAAKQLGSWKVDLAEFTELLAVDFREHDAVELFASEAQWDAVDPVFNGLPLRDFPSLTEASGGFHGVWAVGGRPAVGKSALGLQLALSLPATTQIYYCSYELSVDEVRRRLKRDYTYADAKRVEIIHTKYQSKIDFCQFVETKPQGSVFLIDSLQKLPTLAEFRRIGLDEWLLIFEAMKLRGYHFILLSESNSNGGFKETSEIEYTADLGLVMDDPDRTGLPQIYIVKNRHRGTYGLLCSLKRTGPYRFTEATAISNYAKAAATDGEIYL